MTKGDYHQCHRCAYPYGDTPHKDPSQLFGGPKVTSDEQRKTPRDNGNGYIGHNPHRHHCRWRMRSERAARGDVEEIGEVNAVAIDIQSGGVDQHGIKPIETIMAQRVTIGTLHFVFCSNSPKEERK